MSKQNVTQAESENLKFILQVPSVYFCSLCLVYRFIVCSLGLLSCIQHFLHGKYVNSEQSFNIND